MAARIQVVEPLGRGGRVFRAVRERADGRRDELAITRVLPGPIRNRAFAEMILGEVEVALGWTHPNLVDVLDVARTPDDAYFVVARYVDGCDLKALTAAEVRLAAPEVARVVVECCRGLDAVHARGLVHHGVAPRTVLVSTRGEVKLAELGLWRATTQHESSDPGVVKGGFEYLSPEQVSGHQAEPRSDVFCVGILAWELLAGRRLFLAGTDWETVVRVREARVDPIDGIDPALDAIVRKALARAPAERYASAAELADALAPHAAPGRDLAVLDVVRARAAPRLDPQLVARMQADVDRMTSIVAGLLN